MLNYKSLPMNKKLPAIRAASNRVALLAATLLLTAMSSDVRAQLAITEIQSNQAATGVNDFWELTNFGTNSVDLSNWKWNDSARVTTGAAVTIPAGTMIAAGESIIFTGLTPAAFRTWWGIANTVQVISPGAAPGLGMNDGISLFDNTGAEVLFLSYAASGFTRSSGSAAAGGHAGASGGGSATAALVFDPTFGTNAASRRYTAATVGTFGAFASVANAADIGSPGVSGLSGGAPTVTLTVSVTPGSFAESAGNSAASGMVTRTGSTAADLVVSLSSSDTTEATVPATVTILATQTSATFNVSAVDDTFPDGAKSVSISATASGATPGTTTISVLDDVGEVAPGSALMLTEILSSETAGAPVGANDFWELSNLGTNAVNLTGYTWHDSGRSYAAASAYALPTGATINVNESVIFTAADPAVFRAWWGISNTVQVFQSVGAPGLGQADGISFFDNGGNELFFFSYATNGFTREGGSPSTGGHAGPSAGASIDQAALIWVPSSGTATPRYTFATGSNYGSFSAVSPATDLGSPGNRGLVIPTVNLGNASIAEGNSGTSTLSLPVTRSDTSTAFTVNYAVTGGTATSGTDYAAFAAGTLTFTAGGAAVQTLNLTVNGDTTTEANETVIVTLSNVANTTGNTVIGTAVGTGTIVNDDIVAPTITTQPASATIGSGGSNTLTVAASGIPAPSFQWYRGNSGDTSNPVSGATSVSFTTSILTVTTSYWVRATNTAGMADSTTATVTVLPVATAVDLSRYVRIGRYDLPEPTRTTPPNSTSLLAQEASGVAYNWDTDTLFITADGGTSIVQVSKTGQLIDSMTLAPGSSPQGTDFYDPEGITYIGNGKFVMSEERDRQLVQFTYAAGTTLSRAGAQTVKLGSFVQNTGTEGLSFDPLTGGFICLKETQPQGIFQTTLDFVAGTASNGSPTNENSTNLFDPVLLNLLDLADVFALANLPSLAGQPDASHLLVLSQESGIILNVDRAGNIYSSLTIVSDPGNPLNVAAQQHEGLTMDRAGILYVVSENGGGDFDHPQLWVYAPSTVPNQAPTAVALNNPVSSIVENTSTAAAIKVADIVVTDDGQGLNSLTVTGADASSFVITGNALYIKAGVALDFETKTSYSVTVNVDDASIGSTPDATTTYTLTVTDVVVEAPPVATLVITEVAAWSSGLSPVGADWFEVSNLGTTTVDITGWKVDDSSASFASALLLNGITNIAPGESVIFLESANLAATKALFLSNWFGANPPPNLQIGSYTGSGIGLGTGGDAVNLYNSNGLVQASVTFSTSPASAPYATFNNAVGLNSTSIAQLSVVGVNGAFVAANAPSEIGSPGTIGKLFISEVAPWSSGNGPVGADWFEVMNTTARPVEITGWKVDDSSGSFAAALLLNGITTIAPGEAVIFLETANLTATRALFLSNWFGANPPAGLQLGSYTGGGIGLSTGGDAVNLYNSNGVLQASVLFGASPASAPFTTFDNAVGLNNTTIAQFSVGGVRRAFAAVNDVNEIGSPGLSLSNQPPLVSFLSPANGAVIAAPAYLVMEAGVVDTDGPVAKVEFFVDSVSAGVTTVAPYRSTNSILVAGNHTLTAIATDHAGAKATNSITITLNAPAMVAITNLVSGALFQAPASIPIQTSVSDVDGSVAQVQFFANGTLLGTVTSSPFDLAWNAVPQGFYNLTAVATDNRGATATSASVQVVVGRSGLVTPSAPVNGTFQFTLVTTPGRTILIEYSTNLLTWTPLLTNVVATGSASVVDPGLTNKGRFYRARELTAP